MNIFVLSNYNSKNGTGLTKAGCEEMERLDALGEPWKILVDISDCPWLDGFLSDVKDTDYDFLDSVDVTADVSRSEGLRSENGCLIKSDGGVLILAPESKMTSIPYSVKSFGRDTGKRKWNDTVYKCIAANFEKYLNDPAHKQEFERVLFLASESVMDIMLSGFGYFGGLHYPRRRREIIRTACRVTVSDEIKTRHYEGFPNGTVEEVNICMERETMENDEKINALDPEAFASFDELVLGEYIDGTGEIFLYPKAMMKTGRQGKDLTDLLISVLAHESFHHLHFSEMEPEYGRFRGHDEYGFSVAVESLASAYEYVFIREVLENDTLADDLSDSWKRHSVLVYPYSGAETVLSGNDNYGRKKGDYGRREIAVDHMLYRLFLIAECINGRDEKWKMTHTRHRLMEFMDEKSIFGDFGIYYSESLRDPFETGTRLIYEGLVS